MNLIPYYPTQPVKRKSTAISLPGLKQALSQQTQPPNSYALGLASDGLPVFARLASAPSLLAASDDPARLENLLATIANTINLPAQPGAILVSHHPDNWLGLNPTVQPVKPAGLGTALQRHLESGSRNRLVVMLDNLGADWDIDPPSLAALARSPHFHLFLTATANYARRCRSLFPKILIGAVHDFATLFDLTAPATLTTPPAPGQFAFRHQSRWLYFSPNIP